MKLARKALAVLLAATLVSAPGILSVQAATTTVYSAGSGLTDGAAVPGIGSVPGSMGVDTGSGGGGTAVYNAAGDYIEVTSVPGKDMKPTLAILLPAAGSQLTGKTVTAEFKFRPVSAHLSTHDVYLNFGFAHGGGTPGFDNYFNAKFSQNGQGEIRWTPENTMFNVKSLFGNVNQGSWYGYKLVWNVDAKTIALFVNNSSDTPDYTYDYSGNLSVMDSADRFSIGYGNWGGTDAFTYDIGNFTITTEDSASGSTVKTWVLNDQLTPYYGQTMPAYAQDQYGAMGSASAWVYFENDKPYVYVPGAPSGSGFALRVAPDNSPYNSGVITAEFDFRLDKPGTDWVEMGFGTNVTGSGNVFALKGFTNFHEGNAFMFETQVWSGLNPAVSANLGVWYHAVETVDFVRGTRSISVTGGGKSGTAQAALGADAAVSQFVVKNIESGGNPPNWSVANCVVTYTAPPKAPTLISPKDNAVAVSLNPTLAWTPVNAWDYTLSFSETPDFSGPTADYDAGTASSFTVPDPSPLSPGTLYYWKVTAHQNDGNYDSGVFSFRTDMAVPADGVYDASLYGLIEGDWDQWSQADKDAYGEAYYVEIPKHNSMIIQTLLDKAASTAATPSNPDGITTVLLPPGIYCIGADVSQPSQRCLYINYSKTTLKGSGVPNGRGPAAGGTVLKSPWRYNAGPLLGNFRAAAIQINGAAWGGPTAVHTIRIENFELDGGGKWTGRYDWGYDPSIDYGWDIGNHGINVNVDKQVDSVFIDHMYIHDFRGEVLYIGGHSTGYLEVSNCIVGGTNASCNNLDGQWLYCHDNQWGLANENSRFWMEYSPRQCTILYTPQPLPDYVPQVMKDAKASISYFSDSTYLNSDFRQADTIAIAQAQNDATSMYFVNNTFDNSGVDANYQAAGVSNPRGANAIFQFCGGALGGNGQIVVRGNTVRNQSGPFFSLNDGGPTGEGVWYLRRGNITVEDNVCENIGGPGIGIFSFTGNWSPYPAYLENFAARNNTVTAKDGSIAVLSSGPNDIVSGPFNISWWGDFTAGAPIPASDKVNTGGIADQIYAMAPYFCDNVEISGNTFNNCAPPLSYFKFLGRLPLFKDNVYNAPASGPTGGYYFITPPANLIKPAYEQATISAAVAPVATSASLDAAYGALQPAVAVVPVTASMLTGVYRDGQPLLLTIAAGSPPVTFAADEALGYSVPKAVTLSAGQSMNFTYDQARELWVGEAAAVDKTALDALIAQADAAFAANKYDVYTAASVAALQNALAAAKAVSADTNASQQQVDDAYAALDAALNAVLASPASLVVGVKSMAAKIGKPLAIPYT
ncbi:MAG: right-handed parallel beta-helix repeat-containing protein, partial [Firmicutes bacterium]|nr:right-handed parallel beta-helix repeat-containing protein [Bacillota bacterium]